MTNAWADVELSAVADKTGNLQQLFPNWVTVGTGATTSGTLVRQACEGTLVNAQIETDGTNGGEFELWDLNGAEVGADVNTATAITAAQLTALQVLGRAKIIWSQKFTGSAGAKIPIAMGVPFCFGLAGRYVNAGPAGKVWLDLIVDGGFRKVEICG